MTIDSSNAEDSELASAVEDSAPTPDTALSHRQRQILDFIRTAVQLKAYPPSMREIGTAVGLKSTASVRYQLNQLEKKGCLVTDPNRPRAIRLTVGGWEGSGGSAPKHGRCPRCTSDTGATVNPLVLQVVLDPETSCALLDGALLTVRQLPESVTSCATCKDAALLGQVTAVALAHPVPDHT
ncbi:hypothetical protein U5640_11540 [Streptomyces sp. SS7]|uniref:LexA family protein n=1 Tax=Streptomyces sp. SS7 TaxID=3108485 RepID=UPI0030EB3A69